MERTLWGSVVGRSVRDNDRVNVASGTGVTFRVRCDGVTYVLEAGESLTFGRHPASNDIVIGSGRRGGEEDTLVSRRAGSLSHVGEQLAVANASRYEQIEVISRDHVGRVRQLAPGDELRVPLSPVSVAVPGRVRRYELIVEPDVPAAEARRGLAFEVEVGGGVSDLSTDRPLAHADGAAGTEGPLSLSPERRLDLAALCAPLLTHRPGRSAQPASYAEAAERRGITRKAMEKRVEHLVAELRRDGLLPGLEPGATVKDALCVFAVRSGTITVADVELLDAGSPL